jgi:hypothetical protein
VLELKPFLTLPKNIDSLLSRQIFGFSLILCKGLTLEQYCPKYKIDYKKLFAILVKLSVDQKEAIV